MEWESQALEEAENIALPPVMAYLVKFDAEKRARKKGLTVVNSDIVKQTRKGYEKLLGREAVELIKKMGKGENVDLPDEFFKETTEELFSVNLCPAKFGACTKEKRDMMLKSLKAIKIKLKEMDITSIMLDKAVCPILSHHALRVSIIGCPNCCLSPYFSDFGVISLYKPSVQVDGCTGCSQCERFCSEKAITVEDKNPFIDYDKCLMCGGCVDVCPKGAIFTEAKGYKVVAGGTGSRHPVIAKTLSVFTDLDGVIELLEESVLKFKNYRQEEREVSFHEVIHP